MRNLIGTKRVFPALLAIGALLVVLLVAVPLLTLHHAGTNTAPHAAPSPTVSPMPAPSGAVTLVHGTHVADGIEVGYPHTTVGAISAASAYVDAVASTLDPDYAASVARVAGNPANPDLAAQFAASTVTLRVDLQLPTAGPLAAPIAFQTIAEMYQLRDVAADHALVLLLTDSTFINAHGGMAQTTGVFPAHMQWIGGDWKLVSIGGSGANYSNLAATPDTQTAANQGWLALIAATGGAS